MFNVSGYKVRQNLSIDNIERVGKCPRGYEHPCYECAHVRIREEMNHFYCSDMNVDKLQISPYMDKDVPYVILAVTFRDIHILDLVSSCTDIAMVPTSTTCDVFNKTINILPFVSSALEARFSTGYIMMEYHRDTAN